MLSIVRRGPKILVIETEKVQDLKSYFSSEFSAEEYAFDDAFEKTEEGYTLILLTESMGDGVESIASMSESILVVESDTGPILSNLINSGKSRCIKSIRPGPKIIVMRVFGNVEKVVDIIKEEYSGVKRSVSDLLIDFEKTETVVIFTKRPLNEKMTSEDIFKYGLYIDEKYFDLYKKFSVDALKYLNEGLEKKDWYEMEIRIYDRYSAYDFHYRKLLNVLENMELGLVLGEAWTKDYPRLFMAVGVYRLRFFSFYEPKYIKKILMGLEYTKYGKRIVDYDLYYKRKHVHWSETIEENIRTREQLGVRFRNYILSNIKPSVAEKIEQFDSEILKTRVDDY